MSNEVTAEEFLRKLVEGKISALIDVRSEKEFGEGSLPHSINAAILNSEERHLVGTEYKLKGQQSAIELGYRLVTPHKQLRVEKWFNIIDENSQVALACWRGGLRSKIAAQWIEEASKTQSSKVLRIVGGYKSVRRELLKQIENPPPLIVVGGWTGSGKTALLQKLKAAKIDIEALANHRGSCFGEQFTSDGSILSQPTQSSFENILGFKFFQNASRSCAIEDESTRIGNLNLPQTLKDKMKTSPVVFLESSPEERAEHIYQEYILKPQSAGIPNAKLADFFLTRLKFLKRHLGGLEYDRFQLEIRSAFVSNSASLHHRWIKELLIQHYDKSYAYAFERLERPVLFRGNLADCQSFLENQ